LQDAVSTAVEQSKKLALIDVLYSPWSASFDMFKNVYDRVEQFEKIVVSL
jgi:UDP-N-acetylmuramoylalanine-D-glutamate ligase